MLRRFCCLLFILVLISAVNSAFAWEIINYMGDVAPDTPGSCGTFNGSTYTWVPWGTSSTMGMVVDDPDAEDGKAYYINDNSPTLRESWRVKPSPGNLNLDTNDGATIVARIKKISETDQGANFGIMHDSYHCLYYWGGANGMIRETVRGIEKPVAGDSQYHILRMTAKGGNPRLTVPYSEGFDTDYAPGNLIGQPINKPDWARWSGTNETTTFQIVEDPTDATNQAIMYTGRGGEDANADLDIRATPDANGIITVTARVHRGSSPDNDPTTLWYLKMLGPSNADLGSWYGRCESARPRLNQTVLGETAFTEADWYTIEARIDVSNNWTDFYITKPGEEQTYLGRINFAAAAPASIRANELERLRLTVINNPGAAGDTFYIDDITVNGTPVQFRTIKLYVDEQADPVNTLVIDNATSAGATPDSFVMGALSAAGMQEVYIDWIRATNAGAFAPGEEETTIGQSLIPTPVTSIAAAKLAPENTPVVLNKAIITTPVFEFIEFGLNLTSFGVEDADRTAGMRVIYSINDWFRPNEFAPGQIRVNIKGTVGFDQGECVIYAYDVQDAMDPLSETEALKPIAIGNKASIGGPLGLQDAAADDASQPSFTSPSFIESFNYTNGPLFYSNKWKGKGTSVSGVTAAQAINEMVVENGVLKIYGGLNPKDLCRYIYCTDMGTGEIMVRAKIKRGSGDSTFWNMYIYDTAGVQLARWYGNGVTARGRIDDGSATLPQALNGAYDGWDILEARIVPGIGGTEYLFNGNSIGVAPHGVGANGIVGQVVFVREDNGFPTEYVYFDDIAVFPGVTKSIGTNNVGLYTTIYGKVTAVDNTASDYDRYFYVDDGSGIKDGSGNIGIKCRPKIDFTDMPGVDDYVAVTGIMGIRQVNGINTRYLWTWTWNRYSP